MPSYVAFLRAINLGAVRKFSMADVVAVTEAAGGAGVQTYLNTGNVRLASPQRSSEAVARTLAAAYATDRGFEVPVVVFTPAELNDVLSCADALLAEHGEPPQLNVTLFASAPNAEAVAAVESLDLPDSARVRGRAAYAFLRAGVHTSTLLKCKEFAALGQGTARTVTVLREIDRRWCG